MIMLILNAYFKFEILFKLTEILQQSKMYVTWNTVFPQIVSFLEQFPPLNIFCGNYSIYEVKNCHNAETMKTAACFTLKKEQYLRKYGMCLAALNHKESL